MKKDMPPIGLTDEQLKLVMTIARPMSPAQRTKFLQLVAQQLMPLIARWPICSPSPDAEQDDYAALRCVADDCTATASSAIPTRWR
jgi:hypothetical protein